MLAIEVCRWLLFRRRLEAEYYTIRIGFGKGTGVAQSYTPSSVMYAEFKTMGLGNRQVAFALIDTSCTFGKMNMRERIESRDRLSRHIVHVAPGELQPELFRDFAQSGQTLTCAMIDKMKANGGEAARAVFERFSGLGAQHMIDVLDECGIESSAYRNALARLADLQGESMLSLAMAHVVLFVATGCTGDPFVGAQEAEKFASEELGEAFCTRESELGALTHDIQALPRLAVVRVIDGCLKGGSSFHVLPSCGQSVEIGAIPSGEYAISDVDDDVSRHHARLTEKEGHWFLEGLGSTNGVSVIGGADKLEHVIEPPRRLRNRNWKSEPYEVFPTDTICLGATTRFMVVPVLSE